MNLARLFSYTRRLETAVESLDEKLEATENFLTAKRAAWSISQAELSRESAMRAAAEAMRDHFKEEVSRLQAQLLERNRDNAALTDRICLLSRTVPVSESLKRETTEPDPEKLKELIDQSIRHGGPVSQGRQHAEAAVRRAEEEIEAQRMRTEIPPAAKAAAASALSIEDLDDLAQTE